MGRAAERLAFARLLDRTCLAFRLYSRIGNAAVSAGAASCKTTRSPLLAAPLASS